MNSYQFARGGRGGGRIQPPQQQPTQRGRGGGTNPGGAGGGGGGGGGGGAGGGKRPYATPQQAAVNIDMASQVYPAQWIQTENPQYHRPNHHQSETVQFQTGPGGPPIQVLAQPYQTMLQQSAFVQSPYQTTHQMLATQHQQPQQQQQQPQQTQQQTQPGVTHTAGMFRPAPTATNGHYPLQYLQFSAPQPQYQMQPNHMVYRSANNHSRRPRTRAIPIVDPDSGRNVLEDDDVVGSGGGGVSSGGGGGGGSVTITSAPSSSHSTLSSSLINETPVVSANTDGPCVDIVTPVKQPRPEKIEISEPIKIVEPPPPVPVVQPQVQPQQQPTQTAPPAATVESTVVVENENLECEDASVSSNDTVDKAIIPTHELTPPHVDEKYAENFTEMEAQNREKEMTPPSDCDQTQIHQTQLQNESPAVEIREQTPPTQPTPEEIDILTPPKSKSVTPEREDQNSVELSSPELTTAPALEQTTIVEAEVQPPQTQPQITTTTDAPKTDEPVMKKSSSMPKLLLDYNTDQWSPVNPDGRKVYTMEQIMKLKDDPRTKVRPENLPNSSVCLQQMKTNRSVPVMGVGQGGRGVFNIMPTFAQQGGMIRQSQGGRTRSQQGQSGGGGGSRNGSRSGMINVSISLRQDVKLKEVDNAWTPAHLQSSGKDAENLDMNDRAKTELYKGVRGILNKLTPENFSILVGQLKDMKIDSQEKLDGVIKLVFEKAVDEPNFAVAYAQMCVALSQIAVPTEIPDRCVNFRAVLLTHCQTEFEKISSDNSLYEIERKKILQELEECKDPERRLELEEEERKMRRRSVGLIRFIGELYKFNMLTPRIIRSCILMLLDREYEESLECACKLLTTI